MSRHLQILLFLAGVLPALPVPLKYYLVQPGKTWSDAVAYCKTKHIGIAASESYDNLDKIQVAAQIQQFSSSAWIGLYEDLNNWRWSMGEEPLGAFTLWASGFPKAYFPLEGCLVTSVQTWWDQACTQPTPFMCYNAIGPNKFVYYSTRMTWVQAQSYCRQHHTDLASVKSSADAAALATVFSGSVWLGLYRDAWKWVDNSNKTNFMWAAGEPDNAGQSDHCAYITNNQVADGPCTTIMPFFCYRIITGQQQIIKIKIQSEQDMKSLTMQTAILNMIEQRLKKLGVAGVITVQFREQPNGEVFNNIS